MIKKSPIEMERNRIVRVTRTITRLKYSLLADEEINELLPERLEEFDKSLQAGELKKFASLDGVVDVRD